MSTKLDELRLSLDAYHRRLARLMSHMSNKTEKEGKSEDESPNLNILLNDLVELIALTEQQIEHELSSLDEKTNLDMLKEGEVSETTGLTYFNAVPCRESAQTELQTNNSKRSPSDDEHNSNKVIALSEDSDTDSDSDSIGDHIHKVLAPYRHLNGTVEYLSAFYLSNNAEHFSNSKADEEILVFFLTPLTLKMSPCPDYPGCKRKLCKYSHGFNVKFSQLRKNRSHSYRKLKLGKPVLYQMDCESSGCLWSEGTLSNVSSNGGRDNRSVTVQVSCADGTELITSIDKILPRRIVRKRQASQFQSDAAAFNGGEDTSGSSSSDEDHNGLSSDMLDGVALPCLNDDKLTSQSNGDGINLNTVHVGDKFGGWENHTKGIGLKLMEKMGYIKGKGLGKDSDGRVLPVEARVLPNRKSLDYCIKLKNSKRLRVVGDNAVSSSANASKELTREGSRENKTSIASKETKPKGDLFQFMNENVGSRDSQSRKEPTKSGEIPTKKRCPVNSSISEILKQCASKTNRVELNTFLMTKKDQQDKLIAQYQHLKKKAELNSSVALLSQMSQLQSEINQANLQVSTIEKFIEKKQCKKDLTF